MSNATFNFLRGRNRRGESIPQMRDRIRTQLAKLIKMVKPSELGDLAGMIREFKTYESTNAPEVLRDIDRRLETRNWAMQ